jgi:hypothetical protein
MIYAAYSVGYITKMRYKVHSNLRNRANLCVLHMVFKLCIVFFTVAL